MKKILGLLFVTAGLAFAGLCANAGASYMPAYAEGETTSEEVFVEKTYVYQEGNNKATIVLTSPTELSMTIDNETKIFGYVRNGNIVSIDIGGTIVDVQVNDITGTFDEPTAEPVEPVENWFKKQWNTFVVPLIAGGTGITLLAGLISVGVTFVKNKKLDEKILAIEGKAQEKYNKAEEKLLEINNILVKINDIYKTTIESGKLNEQVKEVVTKKLDDISKVADETAKKACKIDDLIKIQALLVELESKVAEQSKEIVKSGIIKDIEEIRKLIKNI